MPLVSERLNDIVAELVRRPGHEKVRTLVYEILVNEFDAESSEIIFEQRLPEVRGRLDALLGQTVLEFKRDLRIEKQDAEEELTRYLSQKEVETAEHFVGIATDGCEFIPYELRNGKLVAFNSFKPDVSDPRNLIVWLDAALAIQSDLLPEPEIIQTELGRTSLTYQRAKKRLIQLWEEAKENREALLKKQLWEKYLTQVYGSSVSTDDLFIQHTYLTIVAKTMAIRLLGLSFPNAEDLLSGKPFQDAGILGTVESDFFDWMLGVYGGSDLIDRIGRTVMRFKLEAVQHDVLKGLYESLIDPEQRHDLGEYYTPDWLAFKVCERAISNPLEQKVLDPSCGSGTFLFHAIRRFLTEADKQCLSSREAISLCCQKVLGIDIHPVAVLIARVTYLLAFGEERLKHRPTSINIPVYLGDSLQWNTGGGFFSKTVFVVVPEENMSLQFPESVAQHPEQFDSIISMMLKLSEQDASPIAVRNNLEQKESIAPADLEILTKTYTQLSALRKANRNHIWGYVARNMARPIWLSDTKQRADVIIGNPPWLSYRYMSKEMQEEFKNDCKKHNLWVGGKLATQQDLSALFFARAVELYLKENGTIAFVLPGAALNRQAYAGLRKGQYTDITGVTFQEGWSLDETVQPLFPVPSCILFAQQTNKISGILPEQVLAFSGQLPKRDATVEQAEQRLAICWEPWPQEALLKEGSSYRNKFRQGATLVPRMLCVVEKVESGWLGSNPQKPLVKSWRSAQEKKPWKSLPGLQEAIESLFLHPMFLGESIAPFRVLKPFLCIIPWEKKNERLLNAEQILNLGYTGLPLWMKQAEKLWDKESSGKLTLKDRWDYNKELTVQFPIAPLRVLYSKSGTLPAAMLLQDKTIVIDHKLYWAKVDTLEEGYYLIAILNSETARSRIEPMQSRGQWGARDFDKLMFELPIPLFDLKIPLHQELSKAAIEAEQIALSVDLPEAIYFTSARRMIRNALKEVGISEQIDDMVAQLLYGGK